MRDAIADYSPHRYRESYRAKLTTVALVVVLVAAVATGLFLSKTDTVLTDAREHQLTDAAGTEAETVQQWLHGLRSRAVLASQARALRTGDAAARRRYLEAHEELVSENAVGVHVVDTGDGTVAASSLAYADGEAVASPALTRVTSNVSRHGVARITHPFTTDLAGEGASEERTVVGVVSPIPGRERQVVVVLVDLRNASEVLLVPKGGESHVLMDDGTVLLSTDGDHVGDDAVERGLVSRETLRRAKDATDHDHRAALPRANDGNESRERGHRRGHGTGTYFDGTASVDGRTAMQAVAPVPGEGAIVTISQPRSTALAVRGRVVRFVGTLSLVLVVVGLGLFAVTVGRTTLRDLDRLSADALAVADGELDREIDGDRDDEFGDAFDAVEEMRAEIQARIDDLERLNDDLERRNDRLTDAVDRHSEVMARCAEGDLTARMDADSGIDQIDALAGAFNGMVEQLEGTVADLDQFAATVAADAEEVTASAREVEAASHDIAESIEHISDGTDRQHENVRQVTAEMETLSTTTEEIASQANQVARLSENTTEKTREARQDAKDVIAGMQRVQAATERTVAQMDTLADRMDEIDRLTATIETITHDTDRIALNANIEAARAHEDATGDGFEAVAEEIRDLAENARESAQEINRIVDDVEQQSERTVESMHETGDLIAEQTRAVERTVDALDVIAEYAGETESGVQEISAATQQQASSTQEVVAMADRVAEISETNAEEATTVASAAREQADTIGEVSRRVSSLSAEADDLSSEIGRFETSEASSPELAPGAED